MELDKDTEAGIRRFLNQKHGKALIALLHTKRPVPNKADLKELVPAAMMAAEIKGFSNIIEDMENIQNNTQPNNK